MCDVLCLLKAQVNRIELQFVNNVGWLLGRLTAMVTRLGQEAFLRIIIVCIIAPVFPTTAIYRITK